jgi:type III pantothenate kinase
MKSLLIDAGNTSVKVALFEDEKLQPIFRIPTSQVLEHPEDFVEKLKSITFSKLGTASVVKEITELIKKNFPGALIVSTKLKLPIKIDYKTPELLGADRIAVACGGLEFADSFITVSCGTATVVDIVENRTFKGGIIFPGLEIMAEILNTKTSQLPKVEIEEPFNFPGKSSKECVRAGIILSTIGGIKEISFKFPNFPIFVTGGWGGLVAKFLKTRYIPELSFLGLIKILKAN